MRHFWRSEGGASRVEAVRESGTGDREGGWEVVCGERTSVLIAVTREGSIEVSCA